MNILRKYLLTFLSCFIIAGFANAQQSQLIKPFNFPGALKNDLLNPYIQKNNEQLNQVLDNQKAILSEKINLHIEHTRNYQFIMELPNDSAYFFTWNTDDNTWKVNSRLYYYFTNTGYEILQDLYIAEDGTWNAFSKTVVEFNESGNFVRETESVWEENTKQWKPSFYEEVNNFGKTIEIYSKSWNDTLQQFTGGIRQIYTYVNDTSVSEETIQDWNKESKNWNNQILRNTAYNSNGSPVSTLEKQWNNEDNIWENTYNIIIVYNELGDLIEEIDQTWDKQSQSWVNNIRFDLSYDNIGNMTQQTLQLWDTIDNQWVNRLNLLFTYNDFFQDESDLIQIWSNDLNSWQDSLRNNYTYDANGTLTGVQEDLWKDGDWLQKSREEYTYDSQGQATNISFDFWNESLNKWDNGQLISYTYQEGDQFLSQQLDYWNKNTQSWETSIYYEFNETGNIIESYQREWNDTTLRFYEGTRNLFVFNGGELIQERTFQQWDTVNYTWLNTTKIEYYWSSLSDEPILLNSSELKIYPNPFSDKIYVSLSTEKSSVIIQLKDIQGRNISEWHFKNQKHIQLPLANLKNGVYLLRINEGNKTSIKKIIKNN